MLGVNLRSRDYFPLAHRVRLFSCIFLIVICFSCGLEEFYFLDRPIDGHKVSIKSEVTERYIEFFTNEANAVAYTGGGFDFLGTDIYYRIYRSKSDMEGEVSAIRAKGESSSALEMIETYRYEKLHVRDAGRILPREGNALIEKHGVMQKVFLRVFDEGSDKLKARLEIDGVNNGIPVRKLSGEYQEFSGKIPNVKDPDVKEPSLNQSDQDWFVAFFAVSCGRDAEFVDKYSDVLYLGPLKWVSP